MSKRKIAVAILGCTAVPGCVGDVETGTRPSELVSSADMRLSDLGVTCTLAATDDAGVTMTLRHVGRETILVSPSHTPWRPHGAPFRVSSGQTPLPYHGILAAYGETKTEEFLELRPGGQLKAEGALSENFDMAADESYVVELASPVLSIVVDGEGFAVQHDCAPA